MSFSFCLNKGELLLLAGFGLLYQGLTFDQRGKLIQGSQRLLCSVIEILERNNAPGAAEFKRVTCAMISIDRFTQTSRAQANTGLRQKNEGAMPAPPKSLSKSSRKLQAIASRFTNGNVSSMKREGGNGRRSTAPNLSTGNIPLYARSNSQNSVSSAVSDPLTSQPSKHMTSARAPLDDRSVKPPNLDYLSFNNDPTPSPQPRVQSPTLSRKPAMNDQIGIADWGVLAETQPSLDSLFPSADVLSYITSSPSTNVDWYSNGWNMAPDSSSQAPPSQGSGSEEEITSGEELSSCDLGGDIRAMTIPVEGLGGLDGLDGNYVL